MLALYLRDVRLGIRAGGGAVVGILFFLAVVTVAPFAVGPDMNLLARIGPAMLWTGALLAALLGLDRLFQADRDDGSLDLLLIGASRHPLALIVLVKCLAHWTTGVLPLVVVAPVFGLLMNMDATGSFATQATLLAGTPAIVLIGAAGAAVTVSLPRGGLLVSVLVLPLVIPVLIFGVSAAYAATTEPDPFLPPFMLLCATTFFAVVVGPLGAAVALKESGD